MSRFWRLLWVVVTTQLAIQGGKAELDNLPTAEQECRAEPNADQACSWVPNCDTGSCAETCVASSLNLRNDEVLRDRAFDLYHWQMCPELARWVNYTREWSWREVNDSDIGRRRKLLQGWQFWTNDLLQRVMHVMHASNLILHETLPRSSSPQEVNSSPTFRKSAKANSPEPSRGRGLNQFPDLFGGLESPETLENIPEENTLKCPSDDLLSSSRSGLLELAILFERLFQEFINTGTFSEETSALGEELILTPNKFLVLMELFSDPDRVKSYMQANCAEQVIDSTNGLAFGHVYTRTPINLDAPDFGLRFRLCTDNHKSWEEYHRRIAVIYHQCYPLFHVDPDCHWYGSFNTMIGSGQGCLESWELVHNVTQASYIERLSETNLQADDVCSNFTSQEECIQGSEETEALQIQSKELMASMPFRSSHPLAQPLFEALLRAANPESSLLTTPQANSSSSTESEFPENLGLVTAEDLKPQESNSKDTGVLVGAVCAAAVVILLVAVGALLLLNARKKNKQKQRTNSHATVKDNSSAQARLNLILEKAPEQQQRASARHSHESLVISSTRDSDVCARIAEALDHIHHYELLFGGRFKLLSPAERSYGSSGVVQMAAVKALRDPVAIKVYTDSSCFHNEVQVYNVKSVAEAVGFVPTLMHNEDQVALMPNGKPFPPFMVSERARSLRVWIQSYTADPITSTQILGRTFQVLKAMHTAGFAHRNIKPSNILQLYMHHDWILCDFAWACRVGEVAPLPGRLSSWEYRAPEVLHHCLSVPTAAITATKEADIWAIGLVAFRLLTNEEAYPPNAAPERILASVNGDVPFPWENGASGAEQRREKLRGLRKIVLACLSRNPSDRPSASSVLHSLHAMFDNMTSHGTFATTGQHPRTLPDIHVGVPATETFQSREMQPAGETAHTL